MYMNALIKKINEYSGQNIEYTYDEYTKRPHPLVTSVLNYIREAPRPPIKSLLTHKNELYIIRRHTDKTNSYLNIGFGVKGFQCPASKFVFNVI